MKNNTPLLWIIALFVSIQCTTQDSAITTINELCEIIGPANKIIGLGESAHGTKEFTMYRSQIVKELVTKFGDISVLSILQQSIRSSEQGTSMVIQF